MMEWLLLLVSCYAGEMNLQRWEIESHFAMVDTVDYVAGTLADPEYLVAALYFNIPAMELLDSAEVRRIVVHELTHVRLWPLDIKKGEEALAEWIARFPGWQTICR